MVLLAILYDILFRMVILAYLFASEVKQYAWILPAGYLISMLLTHKKPYKDYLIAAVASLVSPIYPASFFDPQAKSIR